MKSTEQKEPKMNAPKTAAPANAKYGPRQGPACITSPKVRAARVRRGIHPLGVAAER